ncbi:hypothetical protein CVD28_07190 [Bacillus sp. M6-12]|nr:hypothetical protein CVD28_07190 [Bacillus sp. M6-12]
MKWNKAKNTLSKRFSERVFFLYFIDLSLIKKVKNYRNSFSFTPNQLLICVLLALIGLKAIEAWKNVCIYVIYKRINTNERGRI